MSEDSAANIQTVAPGTQASMDGAINSSGGLAAARAMMAAQRAQGVNKLDANGRPVSPQTSKGNPSEAGRILAQQAQQARVQRQAEAARQAQAAEAQQAEAVQHAANNAHATDGLETDDQLQSGETDATGDGQSEISEADLDQAMMDLGEGVTMSRAEIKQHLMRQADYTQKTQHLSAERQAFEADRSQRLGVLDAMIAGFQNQMGQPKSLEAHLAEDPVDGLMNFARQQTRLEQLAQVRNVRSQEQAHHTAMLRDSTVKALAEKHGDKAPGYFKDAVDYAHGHIGGDRNQLEALMSHPFAIEAAHKARQWDALQASQGKVKKTVAGVPPVTRPGTRVSGQQGAQSAFQKSIAALKASGKPADAVAALRAQRAARG